MQQLSRSVDAVLTDAYIDVYGNNTNAVLGDAALDKQGPTSGKAIELVTSTSPLSSSSEVLALFKGGLADYESAAPLALHAVGLSQIEIEAAMKRYEKQSLEEEKRGKEDRAAETETRSLAIKAQRVALSAGTSDNEAGATGKHAREDQVTNGVASSS